MTVLVAEDVWGEPFDDLARELAVRRDAELWTDRGRLAAALADARALVVRNRTRVDAELLDAAPKLAVVARAGVGLDNIDLDAAAERNVAIVAPLGANARSVAELTIGLALDLARGISLHDREVRHGQWNRAPGIELAGRTWGLLGAGATGRAVAELAGAFGMPVIAHDPFQAAPGIPPVGVDELFAGADIVSLHVPLTDQTRGLVGERLLARMRPGSLLINVGRGGVVDEAALAVALRSGRPAGAALDVRASEPPRPGELETLDNVVLTPHVAGITVQSQERIVAALAADIRAVLSGVRPRWPVT